ncbi:hypothetical protein [Haladaptatus halobius]|uniref:hypothetical protein n=1 Tax=Haladaptatus halobius TaxID=2884875 RepID=UPI001D0BD70C|nr:hypothetical protein [Haladaptatus halobius]
MKGKTHRIGVRRLTAREASVPSPKHGRTSERYADTTEAKGRGAESGGEATW